MPSSVILASPHDSDRASIITVGSETSGNGAINLFKIQPSDVWRVLDLDNSYLILDRDLCNDGGPKLLWLGYHNGTSSGEIRIRAADDPDDLISSPSYDSTETPLWKDPNYATWDRIHTFVWLSDTQLDYRYWRIDISDSANPDGYFQAGRLYLCNPFQPTAGVRFNWALGIQDASSFDVTQSGATFPTERSIRRVFNVSMFASNSGGNDPEAEFYENIFLMNRYRGSHRDVLFILDKNNDARSMDWSIYGLMSNLSPVTNTTINFYEQPYIITEMEYP